MTDDEDDDRALLDRFRQGEEEAATRLYHRYADRLRALAGRQTAADLKSRLDPDDIVQSVFRTFFRRAAQGQYDVPAGEELWKLFLVIALNKVRATGAHHHAARRDSRNTAGGEHLADAAHRDETALAALHLVIDELLGRLRPSQRDIVKMRIEGFEMDEIAQRTGRAKRSVERTLQQFRESLRTVLNEES